MTPSKRHSIALTTSLIIAVGVAVVLAATVRSFTSVLWLVFISSLAAFLISFFTLNYRIEKFISDRLSKLHQDLRLLNEKDFSQTAVTTDMNTLTKEVERFAEHKKLEIEAYKVRENYRREFMGTVAHELKTPLFTVQGYIFTLLDGAMDDEEIRTKYLEGAGKAVERLIHIVGDLDMITQLESGQLVLQKSEWNLIELIESLKDMLNMQAEEKSITITLDKAYPEPIMVYADRERIEQVLINLVMNSIKYGKRNGTTEISVEDLVQDKALIRITDNGGGIPSDNLSRVFERFYRVDKSRSRKEGGSGLGLSIVKHIVEAHKEKIFVESQLGIGSEFSFTLEKVK